MLNHQYLYDLQVHQCVSDISIVNVSGNRSLGLRKNFMFSGMMVMGIFWSREVNFQWVIP